MCARGLRAPVVVVVLADVVVGYVGEALLLGDGEPRSWSSKVAPASHYGGPSCPGLVAPLALFLTTTFSE